MKLFFSVYGVLMLIFFILLEIISIIYCRDKNSVFFKQLFMVDHTKIVICSVFFPVAIITIAITIITELILDKSERR